MKKAVVLLLSFLLMLSSVAAVFADAVTGKEVITLGRDLSEEQKQQMIESFGNPGNAEIIEVTNEEEHRYLDELLDAKVIGTRAISSAYIRTEEQDFGIKVETNNITWVTTAMYEQALSTAGVKDVSVQINAPFPVSGTAALTGIIKAFEIAGDITIDEDRKKVANQELITTAELGEKLGSEQVTELIRRIKEKMAETKNLSDEEWRTIILQIAADLNITLSDPDMQKILDYIRTAQNLDIDWQQVFQQGTQYAKELGTWVQENPEAKSFLQRLWDWIKGLIDQFFGLGQ